jgi:hypothetical protein
MGMQVTRPLALTFLLLLTGACASTPGSRGSQETATKPLRGGIAEFRITSYDGRNLTGRVLLGATIDPLVIDGRLFGGTDVDLEKVRACGKTELLEYWMADLPPSPRADDIITLRRGYWHGANKKFFLFDETTGPGPDCFEGELVVRVLDGRIAATLPVRVVRTDRPPATATEGSEEPKPPPSDAGAP